VRSDIADLQAKGLMDGDGKLLNTEVPPHMREDRELPSPAAIARLSCR
jgi:hypothetical protein